MKLWVETWKVAGPMLEAVRKQEVRDMDTREALTALESAFNYSARNLPPRESSGLVEMQKYFSKLRP